MNRPARIHLDGYAGRVTRACRIVGETPMKYRIAVDAPTQLGGRGVMLMPGETRLVPKYSVTPVEVQP